ncbi:MAG: hypothetical protein A3H71_01700 [Candidatus Sungbacteria bacterium RIFCSPLOWO2_02_FULL_48_13b]|uniref:VanZ-like domain-containing protein n=2 Tax=Candidatus Sungiibacteriota TaxID=1817917 RepID=A0A1G2LJ41_9BACT|nr:MAG: hypothetical protein A3C12_02370 [Candidatus Sungbacteria bacterium RIFCSPHIGHO2_02_FULL_49_20]OHA11636.1 MAG: hypothetical protein A3H71_01700 [Candidatus Sungbacteria bacterium RIFCSPLOWO2_02_FULL_48_13b]
MILSRRPTRISWVQLAGLLTIVLDFGVSFWVELAQNGYWFWQYDKILHTIAGIGAAAAFLPYAKRPSEAVIATLFLGIAWEILEIVFIPPVEYGGFGWYLLDTAGDLIVEIIGAFLILWCLKKLNARQ